MVPSLFVIAEAGVNHNGRLDLAMELVNAAAASGADAVKFQTFRAENLATRNAPKARYQERSTDDASQFEMLKRLELDAEAHRVLAAHAERKGIEFMSTPFDLESVSLLEKLGVRRFKVPSGELTNPLLLRAMARTGRPLIVSTGMATLGEIEFSLATIAEQLAPERSDTEVFWTEKGQQFLKERVTLLHCTSEYPAPPTSVNLRALQTLAATFCLPVGYSDHTEGLAISAAAVALGATVIEKHFTLDRTLPGPDHMASLEARELPAFVASLRAVVQALGTGRKVPTPAEVPNRVVSRRSLVAQVPIQCGEPFTTVNLTVKRPGSGIPASRYDDLLGRIAHHDYATDDLINE